jgi:galactonate dehydratase
MRITDFRTHVVQAGPRRTWLFVEVVTDEGLVGLGEASQSRNDAGVIHELERLRPQYIGQDPLDLIEGRAHLLAWPYTGRTLFAAVSALEQAIWDLIGKRVGLPVYQLLGGRCRDRVRAYANIGYALKDEATDTLARAAADAVASGFTAVKFYPFGERPGGGHDACTEARWLEVGLERIRAVREAIGPRVDLLIDLMHQFFGLAEAGRVARELEPLDPFWLEDPFAEDDPSRLAEYRRSTRTRLAGGAPSLTRHAFRPLLEAGALDVIMPDVKWLGGILEAKKTAATAETYGVACSPHNASGPVSCAASVHLSFTLAGFLILEYAWGAPPWRAELCRGTEGLVDGSFALPARPGLGVELDAAVAGRFPPA